MKSIVFVLCLFQSLAVGSVDVFSKNQLYLLLEKANNSCYLNDSEGRKTAERFLHKESIETINNALLLDGFTYNSEIDTIVFHVRYSDLVINIVSLSATIDAYSSMGESHIFIDSKNHIISSSNNDFDYLHHEVERIIRNRPEFFKYICNRYGDPFALDAVDDRAIRIVIMNKNIVSVEGWMYIIGPSFRWDYPSLFSEFDYRPYSE
ncbi:MAG: hypothetical protein IJS91_01985 [Bacteroidales bacterium]|nr:hypothetical protein [Bacteroidales bacterium]